MIGTMAITRKSSLASVTTFWLCLHLICGAVVFMDGALTRRQSPGSSISGCSADGDCGSGANEVQTNGAIKWQMPLVTLGHKGYYLGIFFKANWFRAYQFCRYHGLHLVSIESQEENTRVEDYIKGEGMMNEHFWTSGTDQADEGNFFWMGTGRPLTFTNWNAGEPNNFKYENNEEEHCLELWNRDGKGLKWNDTPCSFESYFLCESESRDSGASA